MRVRAVSIAWIAVLAGTWELVSRFGWANPVLISSPSRIARAAIALLDAPALAGDLLYSFQLFAIAVALAATVGTAIGLWIGWSPVVATLVRPLLIASNAVPKVALMPLIVLWVGIGKPAAVLLATLMAAFPVIIATASGFAALERDYVQVARAYGASRWLTIKTVVLPGVAPHAVSGLRVGINYALVGVLIAEFFASSRGIGYRMVAHMSNFEVDAFFVCLLLVAGFALASSALLSVLEARLHAFRPDAFAPAQL